MTMLHSEQVQESTGLVQPKMDWMPSLATGLALVRQGWSPPVQNQRVAYMC
jgi:hypothetical protein